MAQDSDSLQMLIQKTVGFGVSDAKLIPVGVICIEDRLAQMCEPPRCSNYGLAINCPPYVMRPDEFREHVTQYNHALVFKIDVPTEVLLSDDRWVVAQLVHEIAANVERLAIEAGYTKSKGLAAGSCKRLFCSERAKCKVLAEGGDCLFPNLARPSMSGFGINFFELARALGWQANKITRDTDPNDIPMGMMAGMILIG